MCRQIDRHTLKSMTFKLSSLGKSIPFSHNFPDKSVLLRATSRHVSRSCAILPVFTDLNLRSGAPQPGSGEEQGKGAVRITARGKYGTIDLDSPSLVWTSSSTGAAAAANNSSGVTGRSSEPAFVPGNASHLDGVNPFFRVDGERLAAVGFSDVVRLSAGNSFDLAVAGAGVRDAGAETAVEEERPEGGPEEQGKEQENEPRSWLPGSRPTAALLRGDSGSLTASAGVVKVEVNRTPAPRKAPRAEIATRANLSRRVSTRKGLVYKVFAASLAGCP